MKEQLPEEFTEEEVTLLVQGAQKHLPDRTIDPAADEELFYGEPERDAGARPGGTAE